MGPSYPKTLRLWSLRKFHPPVRTTSSRFDRHEGAYISYTALPVSPTLACGHGCGAPLNHRVVSSSFTRTGSPVDALLQAQGMQRQHVSMRIPHFLGAPFVVARSNLILTMGAAPARYAATIFPLRVLPCPLAPPTMRVYMTWRERFNRDPAHKWLRDLSGECTRQVVDEGTIVEPAGA